MRVLAQSFVVGGLITVGTFLGREKDLIVVALGAIAAAALATFILEVIRHDPP